MAKKKEEKRRRAEQARKRRQAKRHAARARRQPRDRSARAIFQAAAAWPLHACIINADWDKARFASIAIARGRPEVGLCAAFLFVDLGCLGIKTASVHSGLSAREYEDRIDHVTAGLEHIPCPPVLAFKIAETARRYAADLGFSPDPEYGAAALLFGDLDPDTCATEVTCGHDGKPLHVSGPNDNARAIMRRLQRKLGPDGYHFVVGGTSLDDETGAVR